MPAETVLPDAIALGEMTFRTIGEQPTPELRFYQRGGDPRSPKLLQQRWKIATYGNGETVVYEWRDVPLVVE
jgi:hypothetical protein